MIKIGRKEGTVFERRENEYFRKRKPLSSGFDRDDYGSDLLSRNGFAGAGGLWSNHQRHQQRNTANLEHSRWRCGANSGGCSCYLRDQDHLGRPARRRRGKEYRDQNSHRYCDRASCPFDRQCCQRLVHGVYLEFQLTRRITGTPRPIIERGVPIL